MCLLNDPIAANKTIALLLRFHQMFSLKNQPLPIEQVMPTSEIADHDQLCLNLWFERNNNQRDDALEAAAIHSMPKLVI